MERKFRNIYYNGKIYTADKNNLWCEAVVTEYNKIVYTGDNDSALSFNDKRTEIIDLQKKVMLPGFIDSHAHIIMGGEYLLSIDLNKAASEKEFIDMVRVYAGKNKKEWITGGNWNHQNWESKSLPEKEWIDEFTKDIPVFVSRMDYHMALANSVALELAGITKATPDPEGGEIVRNEKGEPTGLLKDKAMELVFKVIPEPDEQKQNLILETALEHAKKLGVTSIQDITYRNQFKIFQRFHREGKLTCRIDTRLPIQDYKNLVESDFQHNFGSEKLKVGAVKAFADGSLGSATALFFEPYSDEPNNSGLATDIVLNGNLRKWALECDKNKIQVSIHAIGDKANSLVIDLCEEFRKTNGEWNRRFRIEHAQHMLPDDFKRAADNNIIISMQPYHVYEDGSWAENKIGPERLKYTYAIKSFINSGAHVCFGSDWPVVTLDPIQGIYSAVTRTTNDNKNPEGIIPEEKISVMESVDAYTINAAYASYDEKIKGSITEGKLADMVVLSDDIFIINPEKIKDVKVTMTIFDGEIIYKTN